MISIAYTPQQELGPCVATHSHTFVCTLVVGLGGLDPGSKLVVPTNKALHYACLGFLGYLL